MAQKKRSTTKKRSSAAGRKKTKSRAAAPKKTRSAADQIPPSTDEENAAAADSFARSLEANEQAVPAGAPLRRGATHEVVGRDADGTPIVKRRRFSIS